MTYIESSIAYPFVIACSLFGIVWGIINVLFVSYSQPAQHTLCKANRESSPSFRSTFRSEWGEVSGFRNKV